MSGVLRRAIQSQSELKMIKNLEKLSPRPARFAIFLILLVYIVATSTAKPLSSMDKSEAEDVSVQNGDSDCNHQVFIPTDAGIPGVPAENILHQPDIKPLHRYPRSPMPPHKRIVKTRYGRWRTDKWSAAMRRAENLMKHQTKDN